MLCTGTIFVGKVAIKDVWPSTRAKTALFSSCILECNFKKCGNIQGKKKTDGKLNLPCLRINS